MLKNILLVVLALGVVSACAPQRTEDAAGKSEDLVSAEDFEGEEIELPPAGALPLSEIIASVEVPAHNAITEVKFEDGVWEIEFYVAGKSFTLHIDPMTGDPLDEAPEETSDH